MYTLRCSLVCLLLSSFACLSAQTESQYIKALAVHLKANQEVSVTGGRVDLETTTHAIEVERAQKWKNSIGQALWYGMQLNKKPGIVLLIESPAQRKYAIQLGSALEHSGLNNSITVWLWPDDFPGVHPVTNTQAVTGRGEFWLNLNGNKRHTSSCRWYKNTTKGRLCTADEGVPAGCCH
jgi:hypothetical protein